MQTQQIKVENFGKKNYNISQDIPIDFFESFNVEVSHIYIDELFSDEHAQSILHFNVLKHKFRNYQTCVLVDDYNPVDNIFNLKLFLLKLESLDFIPSVIASESRLTDYFEIFLQFLNRKERKNLEQYVEKRRGKIPCSTLIAIWDLVRLGKIEINDNLFLYKNNNFKKFTGERLITILPKKYAHSEYKASQIISRSEHKDSLTKIHHVYF